MLLMDNQSTVDIFCNPDLLHNVRETNTLMTISTNGGGLQTSCMGTLKNYGDVWYHEKALTNIVGLNNLIKKGYHVSFDSDVANQFTVTKHNGDTINFYPSKDGLYYHDTRVNGVTLLNVVSENAAKYSGRQLKRARQAMSTYVKTCWPSPDDYRTMVRFSGINNCPVTEDDVKIAQDVFGPSGDALKGKTTRAKPSVVRNYYIKIPLQLKNLHQEVILDTDIMWVNKLPFLVTVSHNIDMTTTEYMPDVKGSNIAKAVLAAARHERNGFHVRTLNADIEYKSDLVDAAIAEKEASFNWCAAKEHVPRVERKIRTLKERMRSAQAHLYVFPRLPSIMVIGIVSEITKWLNVFPTKNSISSVYSPSTIVTGRKLDWNMDCRIEIGQAVEAHDNTDGMNLNNTSVLRTTTAIAIGSFGNVQGGYKFLSLRTGKPITRYKWTEIPISELIINRVAQFAKSMNPRLHSYVTDHQSGPCFGIIGMDYPGPKLVADIVKQNLC